MNKIVFSTFATENYLLQNAVCVYSFLKHNQSLNPLIRNYILSDADYAGCGVSSFQAGNDIKWRLLVQLAEEFYTSQTPILFVDSDAKFGASIDTLLSLLDENDFLFSDQNESVHATYLAAATERWKCGINIGFMLLKPTDKALTFLRAIWEICKTNRSSRKPDNPSQEKPSYGWDQMVVNEYLARNRDITYKILPPAVVGVKGKIYTHDFTRKRQPDFKDGLLNYLGDAFTY